MLKSLFRKKPVATRFPYPRMSLSVIVKTLGGNHFARADAQDIEDAMGADGGFSHLSVHVTAHKYTIEFTRIGEAQSHKLSFARHDFGEKGHALGSVLWNLFQMRFVKTPLHERLSYLKDGGHAGHYNRTAIDSDMGHKLTHNTTQYLEYSVFLAPRFMTLSDGSHITIG